MTTSCPQCSSTQSVRNGSSRHGHQRYRCKSCGATFGDIDHRLVEPKLKEQALQQYAEGIGQRVTERLLGVSHSSVMNWVKQEVAGKALAKIDAADVVYVEADELWSYVSEKKAIFGSGGLLIALPEKYSAGLWAVATPTRPKLWVRRFLAALGSLTPVTSGTPTTKSLSKNTDKPARHTPSQSKA
jgi:transposase-like protein